MNTHNPDSRQVLSNLTQAIQESKQALSSLQTKKAEIEQKVDKSMLTYLKGISMMMTCQWISFYHMIFNVDWLGWDIIEPVTYSI
jgi:flagellar biosynthesis chaperone FliJ